MYFTVEELQHDWHEVGTAQAGRDLEAVEAVSRDAGMYRARAIGSRIWHYFWLSAGGRPEPMDG